MRDPITIEMDMTGEFRQCVLKLANIYKPGFKELAKKSFPTQSEIFEHFAEKICKDFAEQLYPIFLSKLHEKFDQSLPQNPSRQ